MEMNASRHFPVTGKTNRSATMENVLDLVSRIKNSIMEDMCDLSTRSTCRASPACSEEAFAIYKAELKAARELLGSIKVKVRKGK